MAGSWMHFSYEALGEQILRSEWMLADMKAKAEDVMAVAVERAPVYSGTYWDDPTRGRYKASFHVTGDRHGGYRHNRAAGICYNDAPEAVFVEYGARAHGKIFAQEGQHILVDALNTAAFFW